MSKKTVKIETHYGTMTFKTWAEAFEFVEIIGTWSGFTAATRPSSVEQAVEYHLAYVEGGVAEVRHVMREREQIKREAGGLPRELWGMPAEVIQAEWEKRMRAGWLGW